MARLLKFPGSDRLYESWTQPLPGDEPAAPPPPSAPPPPPPLPEPPPPPAPEQDRGSYNWYNGADAVDSPVNKGEPRMVPIQPPPAGAPVQKLAAATMLEKAGLPSDLLGLAPLTRDDGLLPEASGYYDPTAKNMALKPVDRMAGRPVNPSIAIHESLHAFEYALTPPERAELQKLIERNPPPSGIPTRHHPPGQPDGPTGITAYFDYLYGDWQREEPTGGAIVGEAKPPIPPEVTDFIRRKVPEVVARAGAPTIKPPNTGDAGMASPRALPDAAPGDMPGSVPLPNGPTTPQEPAALPNAHAGDFQPQNLGQPQRYTPDVERWRPLVSQAFQSRGLSPADVDKALYVIEGESGGNPRAANPSSSARGLVQMTDVHGVPEEKRFDGEASINWMADQVKNHGWTDWGEGVTYEGKPFGILGLKPYNGAPGPQQQPTGSAGGQATGGAFGGGTPALDAYANRVMLGTEEQYSPELTSGSTGNAGQASTASAPPQSKPPAQAPPSTADLTTAAEHNMAIDAWDAAPTLDKFPGAAPGYMAGKGFSTREVDPATGGVKGGDYGPFNSTQGADYVDAPTGTLRAQLEAKRKGKDYLTSNALPALGAALTAGVGGPLLAADAAGVVGASALGGVARSTGVGLLTGRPISEAVSSVPGYEKLPAPAQSIAQVIPYAATGKAKLTTKAAEAVLGGLGMYGGGELDKAAGTEGSIPILGGPFSAVGSLLGTAPHIAASRGKPGMVLNAVEDAASEGAKPLPGQTGMFGESVDTGGKLKVPEGPGVVSDPARGEFGRQGEAFPDPNGGAQAGLLTEGARTAPKLSETAPTPPLAEVNGADLFEHAGRFVVVVKMPDGSMQPFYKSTGTSVSAGGVKTSGEWQPFHGFAEAPLPHGSATRPEGWLIKTGENNVGREAPAFKDIVKQLDEALPGDWYHGKIPANLREAIQNARPVTDEGFGAFNQAVYGKQFNDAASLAEQVQHSSARNGAPAAPGSALPEAPRAPTIAQAAQEAPKLSKPAAEAVAGDMTRSREMVAPDDITFRPDAFQARDVEAGKPFNEPNVKRIVDAWDDNLFEPPIAVPNPEKPGSFIVVAGHHRAEAWKRVKGNEPMPVTVVNADIRDPKQLASVRLLADQTNTATKALNFRETIRTAENSLSMGESVEQTATRMGISPSAVEGLQDAARMGSQAIDRVVTEPTLEPYVKELGRGMRLYSITQEDAAGWFKRIADGPKGNRPTPAMLRETVDRFGSALADIPQGSLFEAGMFKGDRGGILKMIDENARMRTAIQKNINDTQRQIRAVTKLAGDTPTAQRDAKRLSALGEGRLKELRDQLKTNEEDLAAAMRGDEPPPRMPPTSEGPPTGTPGAPPPPPGPREFGDDLVSRMIANAESAAIAKPEMEAARSVERGKRVAAALDQLSQSDLSNPTALAATKEKLRGELANQDFEKVVTLAPEEMQTQINRAVASGDVPYYTGITAQKGAEKFGNGRIPNASEMRALGQVFGPEFQAALERMGDVWKVRGTVEKVIEAAPIEIPTTNGEPLTVDVLAGMLKKNIPGANQETLQTVAQQLLDGERLSIAIGADGKARVTLNGNKRNALQQAVNEWNGRDTFEGVPDQLVPPEQPMMGGARQLSTQDQVTAGPGKLTIPEPAAGEIAMGERLTAQTKERERREAYGKLQTGMAEDVTTPGTGRPQAAPKGATSREQLEFAGSDWKPTSNEGFTQHFWNAIGNIVSAPKTAMAMLDRSGYLRQGGLMVRHGKEMLDGVSKTMVIAEDAIDAERLRKGLGLPDDWHIPNAEEVMTGVNKGKWADQRKQAGLVVEEWGPKASPNLRNENFVSRMFDWLPGAKMSERAFTVFLNKLRADVFDSIAEKWTREGRTPTPAEFKSLATYLNAATGHGNLGQFEGAASALSRLWFSPRNVAARFQVLGQLFNPATPNIVRKEMAKDLAVYVGAGVTLLSIAKLSGLADVELDPRSADFGKMKIGGTRIDLWGGYQQMARMVTELYTGETKDATGHVHGVNRLGVVGNYLRNKLSPTASTGVSILDQKDAIGQPVNAKDLLSLGTATSFAPLFLQDVYQAVKEHGAAGIAILPATYFGVGASTYQTFGEQRDAQAQQMFVKDTGGTVVPRPEGYKGPGVKYDELLPRQQEAVKTSTPIKALADQREPSPYMQARDTALQPIQARQDEAEKLFAAGKLSQPLPDIWHDLNTERRGARAALEAAFAKDFDKPHQDAFHKALDGYFNIDEQSGGVADFDATEAKRQEYLAGLPPEQRQWVEDSLQLGREKQSPLRQKYLDYIDKRKAAGYFDPSLDKLTPAERTKAQQALDKKNPEQDALNWYFKGGLAPDSQRNAPTLASGAGIEQALKLAPDRPVKLAGVDRAVNQTPKTLEAWKAYGEKVTNFLDDAWIEKRIQPADFTQAMFTKYGRGVTYDKLDAGEKATVRGQARQAIRDASPVTDAALAYMGYGGDDKNKHYSVHSESARVELKKIRTAYGDTTAKPGYQFWVSD